MTKFELYLFSGVEGLCGSMKPGPYGSWPNLKNSAPKGVYFDTKGSLTNNRDEEFDVETPAMIISKFPVVYETDNPEERYRTIGIVHVLRE